MNERRAIPSGVWVWFDDGRNADGVWVRQDSGDAVVISVRTTEPPTIDGPNP